MLSKSAVLNCLTGLMVEVIFTTGMVHAATPAVITMDAVYLDLAKKRVQSKDAELMPAYEKLIADANALLTQPAESVTRKKILPKSGTKNDYLSLAPYWWPDPTKPDGLPYIQRDGEFNPSSKNGDSDSMRLQFLCMGVQALGLAYHFTGDKKYADKAAQFIRTWFLTPETRMNPNLNFAQAVQGITSGRGIGLIDTRNLFMVIDAAILAEEAGALSKPEMTDLRSWFANFVGWMQTNPLGIDEFNEHNNHGTFYDMQVAAYSLFVGDKVTAQKTVERAKKLRVSAQIAVDGKQHAELERTTPFHYSAFNLDAMSNLARYGEQVKNDILKRNQTRRGLRNGIDYLAQFAINPEKWPHKELKRMDSEVSLVLFLKAERAYGGGAYANIANKMPVHVFEAQEYIALYSAIKLAFPSTANSIDRLIWPIK